MNADKRRYDKYYSKILNPRRRYVPEAISLPDLSLSEHELCGAGYPFRTRETRISQFMQEKERYINAPVEDICSACCAREGIHEESAVAVLRSMIRKDLMGRGERQRVLKVACLNATGFNFILNVLFFNIH